MVSPAGPYELKIEGNGNVRRFFSSFTSEDEPTADTPAIRRIAPRNVSLIFIRFLFLKDSWGKVALGSPCGAGTPARRLCSAPIWQSLLIEKPRLAGLFL